MNTLTLPAANAALVVAGHQSLVRLSGPVPEMVGQRVAIWADTAEPEIGSRLGDWYVRPYGLNMVYDGNVTALSLHPGHIVGSARITDVAVVVEGTEHPNWPHVAVQRDELWHCDPVRTHVSRKVSDQLPFLPGLQVGDHVAVLADAKPTSERCPRCEGQGHYRHTYSRGVGLTMDPKFPCRTCGGRGSCDPIPHPGLTCLECGGSGMVAPEGSLTWPDAYSHCECGERGWGDLWDWTP